MGWHRFTLSIVLFPAVLSAAQIKRISDGDLQPKNAAAVNQNFKNIDDELKNCVHKTSTETIRGYKYFIDPASFYQVSGDTATFAFSVYAATASGSVGVGTTAPGGKFEVAGGRSFFTGASENFSAYFRYNAATGGQFIGGNSNGELQFSNVGGGAIVALSTNSRVHIQPVGEADVQLEVSNGASTGGGTAHAASFAAHSSSVLKSDIRYLPRLELDAYYNAIKNLKPAEFRYKRIQNGVPVRDASAPLRRGLILEDVPTELKRPDDPEAISLNDQIFALQATVKILIEKIEALEAKP